MVVLIQQTKYLLDRMIARQEADFKKLGGVRERMHVARAAARRGEGDKALYRRLDSAATPEDLAAREAEIRRELARAAASIRRRKGWGGGAGSEGT